jgi:hypothetical protein
MTRGISVGVYSLHKWKLFKKIQIGGESLILAMQAVKQQPTGCQENAEIITISFFEQINTEQTSNDASSHRDPPPPWLVP